MIFPAEVDPKWSFRCIVVLLGFGEHCQDRLRGRMRAARRLPRSYDGLTPIDCAKVDALIRLTRNIPAGWVAIGAAQAGGGRELVGANEFDGEG